MDCPHCGKPVLDDHVMNAKAKILATLNAGQPFMRARLPKSSMARTARETATGSSFTSGT
jgi:hypothetical protein